jgi:hypothetical protein
MNSEKQKGTLIQTGIKNKNGRIYPKELFDKAIEDYLEIIKNGSSYGELYHPTSFDVSLARVSHIVTKIYSKFPKVPRKKKKSLKKSGDYSKDTFVVEYKILDTVKGREVKKIHKDLVPSLRGTGSVNENGTIDSNYKILAIDLINKKDKA